MTRLASRLLEAELSLPRPRLGLEFSTSCLSSSSNKPPRVHRWFGSVQSVRRQRAITLVLHESAHNSIWAGTQ